MDKILTSSEQVLPPSQETNYKFILTSSKGESKVTDTIVPAPDGAVVVVDLDLEA